MKKILAAVLVFTGLVVMPTFVFSATSSTATSIPSACPLGMVQIRRTPYCIDAQKAAGTQVTWGEASAHCVDAGKRLCTASEYHNACLQSRLIGATFSSTDLEFIDGAAAENTFIAMQPCELPHEVWNAGSDRYRNYRCCKDLPSSSPTPLPVATTSAQ